LPEKRLCKLKSWRKEKGRGKNLQHGTVRFNNNKNNWVRYIFFLPTNDRSEETAVFNAAAQSPTPKIYETKWRARHLRSIVT
jgi:hypothetical protein